MYSKALKKNLWILLWGGFLFVPMCVSAQFDAQAMYRQQQLQNGNDPNGTPIGANPFQSDDSNQQAEQTDTTKKKRIRK